LQARASLASHGPTILTAACRKALVTAGSSRKNGLRCSSAVGYLRPARSRANLAAEVGAQATRVLFDGARATGVECRQGGKLSRVTTTREVILAAGSLHSPQLLQLSGFGPASMLQQFGIPVGRDLPGVGKNLQDHLQLRLIFKCTKPITTNDDLAPIWRSTKIGLKWLLRRTGPLAVGINQSGLFTRALPEATRPDIQFHFATRSADLAGVKPHLLSGFTMSVCQLRPTSRGHVRIQSSDPLATPAMQPKLPVDGAGSALRGGRREVRAPALGQRGDAALCPR
jgi:choline dehydrogenase